MLEELLDLLDLLDVEIVVVYFDDNYVYHKVMPRNIFTY